MKSNYYAVIMAGGIGSRFWPLSTAQLPKQFHDILDTGKSLLQETFCRVSALVPVENIFIATNKQYKDLVLNQLPSIHPEQLLLEPQMRNTAPAILLAALKLYRKNPDAVMLTAPADHWIADQTKFVNNIQYLFDTCSKKDILMTLGVQPTSPNTGYGYIKFEESLSPIKKVITFTEKPTLKRATAFLKEGNYLWNAGIFVWSAKSILTAFKKYLPEMVKLFNTENEPLDDDFIINNYAKAQHIAIDFGIMERAENVSVLPVNFGWNDLGTWDSLYEQFTEQGQENAVIRADVLFRNANGNIISTATGKKVVIQGLDNFIIVEKDNILLICPKKEAQNIKEISKDAEANFGKDFNS